MNQLEHRVGQRKPFDIEVIVDAGPAGTVHGRMRNVSLAGVFLEMAVARLSNFMPIRLQFTLPVLMSDNGTMQRYRWRGFIVRRTQHGIGAVFESADPQDLDGLLALLEAAEHRPTISRPAGR